MNVSECNLKVTLSLMKSAWATPYLKTNNVSVDLLNPLSNDATINETA